MDQKIKDLLEKVKATATTAAEAAGKAADAASKKAGELAGITKLNLQIFDLNTDIELLFKEIGKSVYLTHTGAEIETEEIDGKIAQIDEKYAKIAELKENIASRKTTSRCPNCGRECDKGDAFCSSCGAML